MPQLKALTVRIPAELHRKLRYVCFRDEVPASGLVTRLLEAELADVVLPEHAQAKAPEEEEWLTDAEERV